jgi:hypothetical protein
MKEIANSHELEEIFRILNKSASHRFHRVAQYISISKKDINFSV